jgi:hypothetical protein
VENQGDRTKVLRIKEKIKRLIPHDLSFLNTVGKDSGIQRLQSLRKARLTNYQKRCSKNRTLAKTFGERNALPFQPGWALKWLPFLLHFLGKQKVERKNKTKRKEQIKSRLKTKPNSK